MATAASLGSVLSFGDAKDAAAVSEEQEEYGAASVDDDSGDEFEFEFAFAPPLLGAAGERAEAAPAGDIFAHGRILPAYPVFDRRLLLAQEQEQTPLSSAAAAEPEPDSYCAWTPRSAPGSPGRDAGAGAVTFPKSASTGEPRRLRLRDVLVGSSGRSHSDGKEKFLFLQPTPTPKSSSSAAAAEDKRAAKRAPAAAPSPSPLQQGSGKKKAGSAVTEMDMATAHRLFYSKTGAPAAGERRPQTSYLTYRPTFVGFFAAAHAIGRSSHHPY